MSELSARVGSHSRSSAAAAADASSASASASASIDGDGDRSMSSGVGGIDDGGATSGRAGLAVSPEDLSRPFIALPTVALFAAAIALFTASALLGHNGGISRPISFILSTISIFWLFTPMHDCTHLGVSRVRWINEVIGRVCALAFLAPFVAFRYVHLKHHKYTNDPEHDPDYWSALSPDYLRPLRWASQELHYYVPFWKAVKTRPQHEQVEAIATVLGTALLIWRIIALGYGYDMLICWLGPQRLAILVLAYTFDYVPHRPHVHTRAANPYGTTSAIEGIVLASSPSSSSSSSSSPSSSAIRTWLSHVSLTLPLLYQNYHNIHHLYPRIPFYRYGRIWWKHRDELIKLGNPVAPFYDERIPWQNQ